MSLLFALLALMGIALPFFGDDSSGDDPQSGPSPQSGTSGDDLLQGGDGPDILHGLDGNDLLEGFAGDDLLIGGPGRDDIIGGDGHDTLNGGSEHDEIFGEAGNDIINAGTEDDYVHGGPGNDLIYGQAGDDFLRGDSDNDSPFNTFSGDDTIYGGLGDYTIYAGLGQDMLFGEDGDDYLILDRSGDTATGGDGADGFLIPYDPEGAGAPGGVSVIKDFSPGEDILFLTFTKAEIPEVNPDTTVEIADRANGDAVVSFDGVDYAILEGQAGQVSTDDIRLVLHPDNEFNEVSWVYERFPSAFEDGPEIYLGTTGDDTIEPSGAQVVFGYAGNDLIEVGAIDIVHGGEGDDTIFASSLTEEINGGGGNDLIVAPNETRSGSSFLGDEILGGEGDDTIISGSSVNWIVGGNGGDHIYFNKFNGITGGDGADQFHIDDVSFTDDLGLIYDFETTVDMLVIRIDPGATPPTVDIVPDAGGASSTVTIGGDTSLVVMGSITPGDIAFVEESPRIPI